jgi:hypothetical protein
MFLVSQLGMCGWRQSEIAASTSVKDQDQGQFRGLLKKT